MYIVSINYTCELTEIENNLAAHIEYLDHYYSTGKFIASGRKNPRTGGVILASTDSRDELDRILEEDPFKFNNLADYDVTEFMPSKAIPEVDFILNI